MARNTRKKPALTRLANGSILNESTGKILVAAPKISGEPRLDAQIVRVEDSRAQIVEPAPMGIKREMVFDADLSFSGQAIATAKLNKILEWATTKTPARLSIRQLFAFILFAKADVEGGPMTMKDLTQAGILDVDGNDVFTSANANARSFEMFFHKDQTKDGFGLNWMYRQKDDFDGRVIYFRLTDEGKVAYREALNLLRSDDYDRMFAALASQLDDEAKMKLVLVEPLFEKYFKEA